MPQVVLVSSELPGWDVGGHGVTPSYLGANASYEIDTANAERLKDAYTHLTRHYPAIAKKIRLQFSGTEPVAAAVAAAIAQPLPPPPVNEPVADEVTETLSVETVQEPPFELTADDQELILVEIEKLGGKTIAEAEPIVIATGGNPDFPAGLRRAYLGAVVEDPDLQKGLKAIAERMLEQL